MHKLMKILAFILFFTIITMFVGTLSATNLVVSPENNVKPIFNNDSNNDTTIVEDNKNCAYKYTKNIIVNKKLPLTAVSGGNETDNQIQDLQMVDTTGIIMSSTASNCGPASLATVMQNLDINISQDVLANLAGTDDNGTTMYGLIQAAQEQGLIAKGLKLKINELKSGNILYLVFNYEDHYSIITNINGTTVYLTDSNLGNINMTLTDFTVAYIQETADEYGYALVITNNTNDSQLSNNNTLTDDEMKTIKGTGSIISEWNNGQNNARIKSIAKKILLSACALAVKNSSPLNAYFKGLAIWNWMKSYRIYYADGQRFHYGTKYSIDQVLDSHYANCCEQARLVVCIARALGLTARYVHKKSASHVWAQIQFENGHWQDLDCSKAGSCYGWYMDPDDWRNRIYYSALNF